MNCLLMKPGRLQLPRTQLTVQIPWEGAAAAPRVPYRPAAAKPCPRWPPAAPAGAQPPVLPRRACGTGQTLPGSWDPSAALAPATAPVHSSGSQLGGIARHVPRFVMRSAAGSPRQGAAPRAPPAPPAPSASALVLTPGQDLFKK